MLGTKSIAYLVSPGEGTTKYTTEPKKILALAEEAEDHNQIVKRSQITDHKNAPSSTEVEKTLMTVSIAYLESPWECTPKYATEPKKLFAEP